MRIYKDFDANEFEAWSGAVDTLDRILNEGKDLKNYSTRYSLAEQKKPKSMTSCGLMLTMCLKCSA